MTYGYYSRFLDVESENCNTIDKFTFLFVVLRIFDYIWKIKIDNNSRTHSERLTIFYGFVLKMYIFIGV